MVKRIDAFQARARELCIADGIDPDSRLDSGIPAWVSYRDAVRRDVDGRNAEAARLKAEAAALVATPSAPKPDKPLNSKAYGSIGHLPMSRLGPGDWHVHEGQARICCEKPRKGDRVIVTEKLDGACMSVANIDGAFVALSRAGLRANDALYPHLRAFAPYVDRRGPQFSLLRPGERIVGEWLALAHGTIYDAAHPNFAPFIAFDIFREGQRILREEFVQRADAAEIMMAHLIHDGSTALSIQDALQSLGPYGKHGSTEAVEGAVWRVEHEGSVDFLAKYVRPDKIDGKYLSGTAANVTNSEPIWMWRDEDPACPPSPAAMSSPAPQLRWPLQHCRLSRWLR